MGYGVLISSVSRKVPLVQAVRKAVNRLNKGGKVIGGDADPNCIAKYFVDEFWTMPKLSDLNADALCSECRRLGIRFIMPTRDGELEYYAKHKETLLNAEIAVMISDWAAVSICLDKLRFYQTLNGWGIPVIATALGVDEVKTKPYVVKERFGAGSAGVGLRLSKEEAERHAKGLKSPIFQPFLYGNEYSVDLYLDRSSQVKGVIARKREYVVQGESQVTTTLRDSVLEEMCVEAAEKLKLTGHVMFQLIDDASGKEYFMLECNSRFGGASTLSLEAGLDSFYWFFLEALGHDLEQIPFVRSEKEKTLIRYPTDKFI